MTVSNGDDSLEVHEIVLVTRGTELARLNLNQKDYDNIVNAALSLYFEDVIRGAIKDVDVLEPKPLLKPTPWA